MYATVSSIFQAYLNISINLSFCELFLPFVYATVSSTLQVLDTVSEHFASGIIIDHNSTGSLS